MDHTTRHFTYYTTSSNQLHPKNIFFIAAYIIVLLSATSVFANNKRGVFFSPTPGDNSGFSSETKLYDKSFAVIIGIDNYEHLPPLLGAVKDAQSIETELKKQGFETYTLINQNASRKGIAEFLGDQLGKKVNVNDRVFIYFAGHGVSTGSSDSIMGYLMPVDANRDSPRSSGISMDELQNWLADYRSKHVMFVADACYSGLALNTRSVGISQSTTDYLRHVTSKEVRVALVAGGAGEEANEHGGHGLFTYFLLEALHGAADSNQDGVITSLEITAYISPRVSETARTKFRAQQNPQMGRRGEGEFIFLNPMGAKVPTGSLYITSSPPGAEIYINQRFLRIATPNVVSELSPGLYTVQVKKDGIDSAPIAVEVQVGVEAAVAVSLPIQTTTVGEDQETGQIFVSAQSQTKRTNIPADVYIDGSWVGKTDYRGEFEIGKHIIEVRHPNYQKYITSVEVIKGEKQQFQAILSEKRSLDPVVGPDETVKPSKENSSDKAFMNRSAGYKIAGHALFWSGLGELAIGIPMTVANRYDYYDGNRPRFTLGISLWYLGSIAAISGGFLGLKYFRSKKNKIEIGAAEYLIHRKRSLGLSLVIGGLSIMGLGGIHLGLHAYYREVEGAAYGSESHEWDYKFAQRTSGGIFTLTGISIVATGIIWLVKARKANKMLRTSKHEIVTAPYVAGQKEIGLIFAYQY